MIASTQDSPWIRRLPACLTILICCAVTGLAAQSRQRASAAVPFHKDPRGIRLGSLVAGIDYSVGQSQGAWLEVVVQGWIWSPSVAQTDRDGFDLRVSATGGEVVREAPRGAVVARLVEGTLLSKGGTNGRWVEVRRAGWVASAGLAAAPSASQPPAVAPVAATAPEGATSEAVPPQMVVSSALTRDSGASRERVALRKGSELAAGPDGARVAVLDQGDEVEVVDRSRDWVKVRLEAWVRAADVEGSAEAIPTITAAMLREQPNQFIGQTVTWRLHFLAHQQADELRREMPRGQPYLLARGPLPESGFVYVMVTPEQAQALQSLRPLDEIRIEAIIRAGRTRFLPTPVVELTRIDRP